MRPMSHSNPPPPPGTVVLIAGDENTRRFFKSRFSAYPSIQFEVFPSIREFKSSCSRKVYACFLMDIKTFIRSGSSEKRFFNFLMEQFPVMRVRLNSDQNDFFGFIENMELGGLSGDCLLDLFLTKVCARHIPHGIRMESRIIAYLSLFIEYKDETGEKKSLKATTRDISGGGCFIVTHFEFAPGEKNPCDFHGALRHHPHRLPGAARIALAARQPPYARHWGFFFGNYRRPGERTV